MPRTIDGGMRIFCEMLAQHKENGESVFSGADAFKLYDTYGFPIDLTVEMARRGGHGGRPRSLPEAHAGAEGPRHERHARPWATSAGPASTSVRIFPTTAVRRAMTKTRREGTVLAIVAEDELPQRDRRRRRGYRGARPDDDVRRDGRSGRRPRHDHQARTACSSVTDVQKNKGGKFMHYGHRSASGTIKLGDACNDRASTRSAAAPSAALTTATHLLQAALTARARRPLPSGRFSGGAGSPALRLHALLRRDAGGAGEGRSSWSARWCCDGEPTSRRWSCRSRRHKKLGATALFGEKYGDDRARRQDGRGFRWSSAAARIWTTPPRSARSASLSEASVASGVRRIEAYHRQGGPATRWSR